jgi:signal transduction histidine kinase
MVEQERLVLLHPYAAVGEHLARTKWIVVLLDRKFLASQLFPELARRYLGGRGQDYDVAVVLDSVTPKVLYSSFPGFGLKPENPVDARLNLFGRPSMGGNVAGTAGGILIHTHGDSGENTPHVFIDPVAALPDEPELLILAQHRQGSLEAAVAGLRNRNLAINFGVLGVLAVTLTLIIVTSQRARILAQMQMDFVAGVSHELRTPLTAISLAARNLEDGVVQPDGLARYGRAIRNQAVQLAGLVDEILLFSETHSGRHVYKIEPVDVSLGIQTTLETMAPLIESSGFTVEEDIRPDLPLVRADAAAFGQCLQNLVSNSLKYGGEKQWIGVKAYAHQNGGKREVCVSVEDRGLGIGAQELKQIFEPFYRSPEVAAEIHGNGLGLPLTKSMVEAMGGRLAVASEPGKGSTFTMHFRPAAM